MQSPQAHLIRLLVCLASLAGLSGCFYSNPSRPDHWRPVDAQVIDSVEFRTTHHYWKGFNFVACDSLHLTRRLPLSEHESLVPIDSLVVEEGRRVAVADIIFVPSDTTDSVWLKLAADPLAQGWQQEGILMENLVPDNPISRFIRTFSSKRTLIFASTLGGLLAMLGLYWFVRGRRRRRWNVFGEILKWWGRTSGLTARREDYVSFYPTLFCLILSLSTLLYGHIQAHAPQTWVEYYFSPTLNPLSASHPTIICLFVLSVWLLVVVFAATALDLWRKLGVRRATLTLASLVCVSILLYMLFSLTIPLYIGYVLCLGYALFILMRYLRMRPRLCCGQCGMPLEKTGKCPRCGALNE